MISDFYHIYFLIGWNVFFSQANKILFPIWGVLTLCLKFVSFLTIYSTSKTVPLVKYRLVKFRLVLMSQLYCMPHCIYCCCSTNNLWENIQLAFCPQEGLWHWGRNEHVVGSWLHTTTRAAHLEIFKSSLFYHRWKEINPQWQSILVNLAYPNIQSLFFVYNSTHYIWWLYMRIHMLWHSFS